MYNLPILLNMETHMKATFDVSDSLFNSAKRLAHKNQTTMRALVEEGLRRVLNDAKLPARSPFKLADARVHGKPMLIPEASEWRQLEDEHISAAFSKPVRKPKKHTP